MLSFLRRRLVSNALSLYAIQGLNLLVPLLVLPYLLKVMGAANYGTIVLAQALMGYGVLLTDFGFNLTAARDISVARNDPARLSQVYWSTQAAKLLLLVASTIVLTLVVAIVPLFREHWSVFLASGALLLGSVAFPQWYFQGLEQLSRVAIPQALGKIALAGAIFLLVRSPADLWLAALLLAGTQLAGALATLAVPSLRRRPAFVRPDRAAIGAALRGSGHMFSATISTTLYGHANTLVLGFISGPQSVAWYSLGAKLVNTLQTLAMPLTQAVFPRAALLFANDRAAAWKLMQKTVYVLLAFVGSAALALAVFAPQAVAFFGGPEFAPAVLVVRITVATAVIISAVGIPCQLIMVASGMTRQLSRLYLVTGVVNVALLGLLVPAGAEMGASICLLLAETLATSWMAWLVWKDRLALGHGDGLCAHPSR